MIRAEDHVPRLDFLLDLYAVDGGLKPIHVSAVILQGARSEGLSFYDDGAAEFGNPLQLVACALLYPLNDETYELVFACRPQARRHMLAIVRVARSTAARIPHDTRVRARCRRDNIAGRRLAWMVGFRPIGIADGFKVYGLAHDKVRQGHRGAVHRRRHVGADGRDQAPARDPGDRARA